MLRKYRNTRILAILLVATLALAAILASCSGENSTATSSTSSISPTSTTSTSTSVSAPANPQIIMSSTTSTRDGGLFDLLIPMFERQTGYKVKPVYVGSGPAIQMGQQGNSDVVVVHAPSLEKPFVDSGAGINRKLFMHTDFIIVGPSSDPAGIKGSATAVDALKKIAAAGSTFYSRGDNSGTDVIDKALFGQAGVKVADGAPTNPKWYIEGGAGTGMLDLLRVASEKGGYTITDRVTFVMNNDKVNLSLLVEGDPALLNIYHVIQVNPQRFPAVNAVGAQAFSDFLLSPAVQAVIAGYGKTQYGMPLYFADAGKTEADLGSY